MSEPEAPSDPDAVYGDVGTSRSIWPAIYPELLLPYLAPRGITPSRQVLGLALLCSAVAEDLAERTLSPFSVRMVPRSKARSGITLALSPARNWPICRSSQTRPAFTTFT